jgi:hypothetical protein
MGRTRIDRMDRTLKKLVKKDQKDNIEFTALNEKIDKLENEKKRDTLIILLPRDLPQLEAPTEEDFKFEQRKGVVVQLLSRFIESGLYEIKSVRHLNPNRKGRQLCEVIFKDAKEAGQVRKAFIEKVKTQDDLKEAAVNLNQTPATRVRVEILRIIANRIKEEVPECTAIVVPHLAKPVIVLYKDNRKRPLSYIQAVKSYKDLLTDSDMDRIMGKLRRFGFSGSPEHAFAIIEEADSEDEDVTEEVTTIPGLTKTKAVKKGIGKRSYAEMAAGSKQKKIQK